jgi:hypothetical protein
MEQTERAGAEELPDARDAAGAEPGEAGRADAGLAADAGHVAGAVRVDRGDAAGAEPGEAGRADPGLAADAGHAAGAGLAVAATAEAAPLAGAGDVASWSAGTAGDRPPSEPGSRRHVTGEPRVDEALARLDELADQPVTEHRAIFDDVHRRLREVLGELDTRDQWSGDAAGTERRAGR